MRTTYTEILNFVFVSRLLRYEKVIEAALNRAVDNKTDFATRLHATRVEMMGLIRTHLQDLREATLILTDSARQKFYTAFEEINLVLVAPNDSDNLSCWVNDTRFDHAHNQRVADVLGYNLRFIQHIGDWYDGQNAECIVTIDRDDRLDPKTWNQTMIDNDGSKEKVDAQLDMLHGLELVLIGGYYSSYDGMEWDFEKIEVRQAKTKYQLSFD